MINALKAYDDAHRQLLEALDNLACLTFNTNKMSMPEFFPDFALEREIALMLVEIAKNNLQAAAGIVRSYLEKP